MMNAKNMITRMIGIISAMVMMIAMAANTAVNAMAAEEIDPETAIAEIAEMVNAARAENGLDAVYVLPYLNEVAEIRAIETAINFDHRRRNGFGFDSAIDTDIVEFTTAAEILAAGCETSEEAFKKFAQNEIMMYAEMTHIGIGVVYDEDTDCGYYWQITFVATEQTFADQYIPSEKNAKLNTTGDITGDGIVDTYDYLALTGYITKINKGTPANLTESQLENADCFNDGIITEADAKVMVRFILGEITTLPYNF